MKYYEGHESVYQKLERAGKFAWGDRVGGDGADSEGRNLRLLLDHVFEQVTFAGPSRYALDLGCGSGPVSAILAKRGWRTLGLDVSATAVKLAQRRAAEQGFTDAEFAVGDIINYPNPTSQFDLIVDACCLHCLVFDADRSKALANIRQLLKPGGVFAVCTKTTGAKDKAENFFTDETGILWMYTGTNLFEDSKQVNGKWYMPQRRILSPETLRRELTAAGFTVTWNASMEHGNFSAICQ